MKILLLLYDLLFSIGFIAYLPVYIWRKKITFSALKEKLGWVKNIATEEVIWIQVVSVGEANVIGNLIEKIKQHYHLPILISTTTLSGNKIAKSKYAHCAQIVFFPLDISFIIKHFINVFKPKIFIAVETEIWPNLFFQLDGAKIPIVIINGRISDAAFRRYKRIRKLIKRIINKCNYIAVQNQMYKERFCYLGADVKKIIVSGNMKFESIWIDQAAYVNIKEVYLPILKNKNQLLFIAGCTHPGEEDILLGVYKDIAGSWGDFRLLLAPRHPERVSSIEKLIHAYGFIPFRISQQASRFPRDDHEAKDAIFLLDTVGDLLYFYSLADICFVGGSLSEDGGHNILEPIYFAKPTIFGPYMDNFLDVEEVVLEKGAGIKIKNSQELSQALMGLVKDEALRNNLTKRCREVFSQERQSLEKNLQIVLDSLQLKMR